MGFINPRTENIINMLVAAEVMAPWAWKMALSPCSLAIADKQTGGGTEKDMKKTHKEKGEEEKRNPTVQVQWNSELPFDRHCQITQNALC